MLKNGIKFKYVERPRTIYNSTMGEIFNRRRKFSKLKYYQDIIFKFFLYLVFNLLYLVY
jgi:hypothetical protein